MGMAAHINLSPNPVNDIFIPVEMGLRRQGNRLGRGSYGDGRRHYGLAKAKGY